MLRYPLDADMREVAVMDQPIICQEVWQTVITLRKAGAATAANMTDADFTNSTRIDFSVTYVVA